MKILNTDEFYHKTFIWYVTKTILTHDLAVFASLYLSLIVCLEIKYVFPFVVMNENLLLTSSYRCEINPNNLVEMTRIEGEKDEDDVEQRNARKKIIII